MKSKMLTSLRRTAKKQGRARTNDARAVNAAVVWGTRPGMQRIRVEWPSALRPLPKLDTLAK